MFIRLENGEFKSAAIKRQFADVVEANQDALVFAVDMPIGFPVDKLERKADGLAREKVGPRRSSVFPALHPKVLAQETREAADKVSRRETGLGVSLQSFSICPKIREVEKVAAKNERVYEVHPEVSFAELAGHYMKSKRQWDGFTERRILLEGAGVFIPDSLGLGGNVELDDVLDAAIAAWSADRIARGVAAALPDCPEQDANGRKVAIWY